MINHRKFMDTGSLCFKGLRQISVDIPEIDRSFPNFLLTKNPIGWRLDLRPVGKVIVFVAASVLVQKSLCREQVSQRESNSHDVVSKPFVAPLSSLLQMLIKDFAFDWVT
jgi:hypothetical protein